MSEKPTFPILQLTQLDRGQRAGILREAMRLNGIATSERGRKLIAAFARGRFHIKIDPSVVDSLLEERAARVAAVAGGSSSQGAVKMVAGQEKPPCRRRHLSSIKGNGRPQIQGNIHGICH